MLLCIKQKCEKASNAQNLGHDGEFDRNTEVRVVLVVLACASPAESV